MLDFIYSVQLHLANEGTSINSIAALFFGLIALFVVIMIVVFGCRAITRLLRQSKKSK